MCLTTSSQNIPRDAITSLVPQDPENKKRKYQSPPYTVRKTLFYEFFLLWFVSGSVFVCVEGGDLILGMYELVYNGNREISHCKFGF